MRALRLIRWIAFAGIALLLAAIAVFESAPGVREFVLPPSGGTASASNEDTVIVPAGVPIGGPFQLTDDKGHPVTDASYRDRWMLVFFAYTNCPDECPLTLQKMAATLHDLGPLADRVAPLFITVDPVRDTPGRLAGADLVSHSTFLYLMDPMDPSGKLTALFSQDVTPEKLTAALRTRLSSPQQAAGSNSE
jgi:cytochrome oxidase Cu insertion factor (SCO1/SenC/PrrC family)